MSIPLADLPVASPPRPSQLQEHLLKVLGRIVDMTPEVYVSHKDVIPAVIREVGHDPEDLPQGWGRKGRSNGGFGAGLYRNITLAFRYAYRDKHPALTIKAQKPGFWGLTEAGVKYVEGLLPRPLPRPKIFHEPLLKVLGRLSGHRVKAIRQSKVIHDVMVEIGIDPDHLPLGWQERGSNRQVKALDRVRWAVKSMRGAKVPLVMQPQKGFWSLTEAGVPAACERNGVPAPAKALTEAPPRAPDPQVSDPPPGAPNETSTWLATHLAAGTRSDLYRMMRAALSRRLPVSACASLIDDHVQNFLLRAVRRNAFRKLLADGGKVPYSKVVAYCMNSGRTDVRDQGTDPISREMLGARTERERTMVKKDEILEASKPMFLDVDGNMFLRDEAPQPINRIDEEDFRVLWSQIEGVFQKKKPRAWARYAGLIAMKTRGLTVKEIARSEGVSRNRASVMLAEARRCVRKSYHSGDLEGLRVF